MDRQNKNIVSTQRKAPQSDQRREGLLIQELLKNNRIRRKLRRVVAMLSAIVMFVTFNSLTRPADTMEVEQAVAEPLNTVEASLPEEAAKAVDVDEAPEEQEQSLPAPEEPQPEEAGAADVSETTSESDADPEQEAADEAKAETKREVNAETDDATVVLSGADFAADSTVTFDWVTSGSRTSEIKKAIAEEIGGAEVEVRPFDLILTPDLVEEMHTTIRFDKAVTLSGLNASNYNKANLNIFFYYSDAAYQVNPSDVGAKFDDQGRLEKLWFKTVGVGTFAIVYQVPAEPTEALAVEETEEPAVEETEAPTVEETEEPAVEETEEPAVEETEEPAVEETEEPAVEETEEPVVEETEEPAVEETEEPAVEETEAPTVEETEEPAVEETEEPAVEETEEPAVEETEAPAVEETEEPAVEETEEPAVEETEEPAVEETEQPAVEETEAPAVEETEEPAVEETEEPAVEETEEPVVVEPVATETPAPTATPAPEAVGTINYDFGSEKGRNAAVRLSRLFRENGVQADIDLIALECDSSALSLETVEDDVVFTALNYFDRIVVVFGSTEVKGEIAFTNPEPQELPEETETPAEAPETEEAVDPVSTVNDARLQGVEGNTVLPENAEVVITSVQDRELVLNRLEKLLSLPRMIRRGDDAAAAQDEKAEAPETADTGSVTGYALFDINVYADDAPVEETGRVRVSFDVNIDMDRDAGVPENAKVTRRDIQIYHLHNNMLVYNDEYEVEEENGVISNITIITDTFSDFIVKYTVDFEYNGFKFSMAGFDSMKLSELFEALHIGKDVADVSSVTFTNYELVSVEGIEGDWLLTSLKAFASEEKLTIQFASGRVIEINVTDAQYTTNLNDLLTNVGIKIDGQTVHDGDTVTVEDGQKFDLHLEFTENDFQQFVDDNTPMVYTLPAGITLGDAPITKNITIDMGRDGKLRNNKVVYDPATNTLSLTWNTRDPNFRKLTATDSTKVVIDVEGIFNHDASHVEFNEDLEVDVEHTEPHDASVQKAGQLYHAGESGNPYGNIPAIKYTVTVTSEGTTTVNVSDTVEGSAVELDKNANWSATSNKGTGVSPTFTEKGFTLNNQAMQDGEVITITYWGKVDTSGINDLTNATYAETGNKVTLSEDGKPDETVTHSEREISYNKVSKSSTGVSEVDADGKQTVNWKVVVNSDPIESIGGTTITDRISAESRAYMSYSGTGIHVVAKNASGQVVSQQDYDWNTGNLTMSDDPNNKNWVFTVPSTNEALTYEITYTTVVDTTGKEGLFSVVNTTEGKPGTGTGSATVGTPEGTTPQPVNYTKKAVDISEDKIVWNISVNVDAGNYNQFKLTEYMPSHAFGSIGYTDTLDEASIEVFGLEGAEGWEITDREYGRSNDDAWKKSGDNVKPTAVVITFYKDKANNVEGLNAATNRTLTIKVVTKNSDGWMQLAAEEGIEHQDYLEHENKAKINDYREESATASPMKKVVYKMRDGKIAVTEETQTSDSIYANVKDTNEDGYIDLNDVTDTGKTSYPAYKFWVVVGGVTKDNLVESGSDKLLVVEDEFDSLFRITMNGEDGGKYTRIGHGDKPTSASWDDNAANFTWTQTDGGKATFTITNPVKKGDNYYPYYFVEYWLVPKREEDYVRIKELTLEDGGEKLFSNKANSGDSEAELDFKYKYSVVDKSAVKDTSSGFTQIKYTIRLNPDKMTLNGGNTMTLTDTYTSNLSVDFGNISVVATDREGQDRSSEVTWDYSQNTGTFSIPDETAVTLTYYGTVIGEAGSLQTVSNTASMEGYNDTVTEDYAVDMSGSGRSERVRIKLLKFEDEHMEGGLNGAVFRLLDQDMNPVVDNNNREVTFTTGVGYLDKAGVIHAAEDMIDYDYNESNGTYYLSVDPNSDLIGSASSKQVTFSKAEDYYDAYDAGNLVTYGDLTASGRTKLGVVLHDGFADITLHQEKMGVALKKERVYYLEEIVAPTKDGKTYGKSFTKYSFLITDQADYTAPGGVYVYHNNDIMTVRNRPEQNPTFKLSKYFTGNVDLTDEQKNQITFQIQRKDEGDNWVDYPVDVWQNGVTDGNYQSSTFTYGSYGVAADDSVSPTVYSKGDALFQKGIFTIDNLPAGVYRVIESNQEVSKGGSYYSRDTEYLVDGEVQKTVNETVGVEVDATDEKSHYVSITNSYFENKYEVTKVSSDTAEALGGAKFKIVKVAADKTTTDVQTGLVTDSNGKLNVQLNNNSWGSDFTFEFDTLYYLVETDAPAGYVMPTGDSLQKYYFYFSSEPSGTDPRWTPGDELPDGETSTDLSTGFASATVPNVRDDSKTRIEVDKKWVNSMGKDITSSMTDSEAVNVALYRSTTVPSSGTVITNGDTENTNDASELKTLTVKNGSDTVATLIYLPGDKVLVTVQGDELMDTSNQYDIKPKVDINVNPHATATAVTRNNDILSWVVTMPSGSAATITVTPKTGAEVASVMASNSATANRVYSLTKAEVDALGGTAVSGKTATLDTGNNWTASFADLDKNDPSGNPYFYYIVETGADGSTSYEVGDKKVIVTNTAPDQLEVNKRWQNKDGENVTSEKTDGSITYELVQVENPLSVGPYTGTGTYSFDNSQLMRSTWNGPVEMAVTGDTTGIKEGSKVQVVVTTTDQYNSALTGDLTATGANLLSDSGPVETNEGGFRRTRTIILDEVSGDIKLIGTIAASGSTPTAVVTVLEEPTNASTIWDDLVKNKIGEVVVTYDDATLTKESAFATSSIRVARGTKAWSSLVCNLPASGTGTRDNAGKRVIYTYYTVEKGSTIPGYLPATYEVNGRGVDNAIANPGDTAVIINQEDVPKTADLVVTKSLTKANASGSDLTFYVGLFTDSEGNNLATAADVGGTNLQAITVANNATSGTVTFTGLTIETTYYVFETNASGVKVSTEDKVSGYAIKASDVTGKAVEIKEKDNTAEIINEYSANGSVTFKQVKTFKNGTTATAFGYTITEYTDSTYATVKSVITDTGSMSASAAGETEVEYTLSDVGDHYYTVKENLPADTTPTAEDTANGYIIVDGVKYDLTEYRYVVNVSDEDHTGSLKVTKDSAVIEEIESAFTNEQLGKLTVTKSLALNPADDGAFQTANADKKYTVVITTGEGENVKYLAADGTLSDTKVTHTVSNATQLVIKNVPEGTYTVTEQETGRVIAGYKFDGVTGNPADFKAAIAGNEKTVALTNTYEESVTDINILKVKDDGTTGLDGAIFTLTKTAGVQTFTNQTTESGGAAKFTGLKAGNYTLTETAPAGYKGIDGTIAFTLTEANGVFTITRTDETADVELNAETFTITVKNHELTDIEVTKEWKNSAGGDHISQANDTITFALYSKTGETTAMLAEGLVVTYQKDGSYAWTGTALGDLTTGDAAEKWGTTTITGLPKYAADGTTEIEYYVLETGTSEQDVNIETTYRVGSGTAGVNTAATVTDDTYPIVIVNQDVDASTSIKIIKVDAQNNATKLSDATFSLKRVKDADGADVEEEATQITNSVGEATFGNLKGGTYVLTETQSPAGYETSFESATFTVSRQDNTMVVNYTDGTNGVVTYNSTNKEFTVTNDAIVDIDATKTWKQNDGTELNNTITNAEVTYTLWRKVGNDGEWEEASDIVNHQVTLKVEDAADADAWKASWTGLPKYYGDALITYKVVESKAKVGGVAIELPATSEAEATDYGTVEGHTNPTAVVGLTNTLPDTEITVEKVWKLGDQEIVWPKDAEVVIGLYGAIGSNSPAPVMPRSTPVPMTVTLNEDNKGAESVASRTFSDLPVYDDQGNKITYSVQEQGVDEDGKLITGEDETALTWTVVNGAVTDEGTATVTNERAPRNTNTDVTKKWENIDHNEITPDKDVSVTLILKQYAYYGTDIIESLRNESFKTVTMAFTKDTNTVTITEGDNTQTRVIGTDDDPWTYVVEGIPSELLYDDDKNPDTPMVIGEYRYVWVEDENSIPDGYYWSKNPSELPEPEKSQTITNVNNPSVTLPETGGMGTKAYTYGGIALMVLAVLGYVLLETRKRGRGEGI